MKFYSRKLIKPGDLNANNTLFGGQLLKWIDEEAGIYAMTKLHNHRVVTKYMSEINTKKTIISIDKIVFVNVDELGQPIPHHQTMKDIEKGANIIPIGKDTVKPK